jgi:hypothetical protein
MHTHRGLDVMVTVAVGRNLKHTPLVAHSVVVADDAFFLDAQDIGEVAPGLRDEGTAALRRRFHKALVVSRQEDLGQEAIGGVHVGDAGQAQFLRQAAL